jgi:hypothetical protein
MGKTSHENEGSFVRVKGFLTNLIRLLSGGNSSHGIGVLSVCRISRINQLLMQIPSGQTTGYTSPNKGNDRDYLPNPATVVLALLLCVLGTKLITVRLTRIGPAMRRH